MAEQILPVTGLDQVGVILDTPAVALPPNGFSDARNVRFRDGAVIKMEGEVNFFDLFNRDQEIVKYVAWWPNPNLADNTTGYYLIIVEDTIRERDVAYLWKPDDTEKVEKGNFARDTKANWQHTFFQGGFALVINNGLDAPHYILDLDGNEDIDMVPDFAQLPGWDSYNINEIAYSDTIPDPVPDPLDFLFERSYAESTFQISSVVINDSELASSEYDAIDTDGNLNPSDSIAGIRLSGTHAAGDTVVVNISTKKGVFVRAGVIRSFGDFLVAGNLVELDTDNQVTIRNLPGVIRTSDVAAPGEIPSNWNPFSAGVSTAEEFVVSDTGIVQDMVELQGNLYIYSNSSISVMRTTGNAAIPVNIANVTPTYGAQTTEAVVEYDGKHLIVGSQDIYLFGGHPGSIQSVADGRVRQFLFNDLNPLHESRMFILRYQQKDEIWICYPSLDSVIGECNTALIWNYRKNNWTIRDLRNVVAGDVGPVPGGGIPNASLALSGQSGTNELIDPGLPEIQRYTVPAGNTITLPTGRQHIFKIAAQDIPSFRSNGPEVFTFSIGSSFSTRSNGLPVGLVFTQQLNGVNLQQFRVALSDTETDVVSANNGTNYLAVRNRIIQELADAGFDTELDNNNMPDTEFTVVPDTNNEHIFYIFHDADTEYDSFSIAVNADISMQSEYGDEIKRDTFTQSPTTPQIKTTILQANVGNAIFANIDSEALDQGRQFQVRVVDSDGLFYDSEIYDDIDSDVFDDITYKFVSIEQPYIVTNPGIHVFRIIDSDGTVVDTEVQLVYYDAISTDPADISIIERPGGSDVVPDTDTNPLLTINYGLMEFDTETDRFRTGTPLAFSFSLHGDFTDSDTEARNHHINRVIRDAVNITDIGYTATLNADSEVIMTANNNGWRFLNLSVVDSGVIGLSNDNFDTEVTQIGVYDYNFTGDDGSIEPIYPSYSFNSPETDTHDTVLYTLRDGSMSITDVGERDFAQFFRNSSVANSIVEGSDSDTTWADTDTVELNSAAFKTITIDSDDQEMLAEREVEGNWIASRRLKGNIVVINGDTDVPQIETLNSISSIEDQNGVFPLFSVLTFIGLLVTTGNDTYEWIVYRVGELGSSTRVPASTIIGDLFSRLRVANPRLSIVSTSTSIRIQPANYSELANFVLEAHINNDTEGANEINRITNAVIAGEPFTIADGRTITATANQFNDPLYILPGDTELKPNTILKLGADTDTDAGLRITSVGVNTFFDVDRPWPTDEVNPNLEFPILTANQIISVPNDSDRTSVTSNKVICADVGWQVPVFSSNVDSDTDYESYTSYFERLQFPISPEFTTEHLSSIALWVDGGTSVVFLDPESYNKLQVRIETSDNPGHIVDLSPIADVRHINTFPVTDEYKVDIRANGRFYNLRITDNLNDTDFGADSDSGKMFNRNTRWRVSGAQLEIMPSGRR